MIQGPGVRICDECVRLCMDVLEDGYEPHDELEAPDSIPTPREIREVLDQYIIGQEAAKVALSVSVYNHYKRIFFGGDDEVELQRAISCSSAPLAAARRSLPRRSPAF